MSTIAAGSQVTVIVNDANSTYSLNPNDVNQAVAAELAAEGIIVHGSSVSGGVLATITPLFQSTYQATFQLQTGAQIDSIELEAMVAQAFEDVTGYVSSQITIPSFVAPGSSFPTNTGEPSGTPTTGQSITDSIKSFFSGLQSTATTLAIALVGIVVLVLVLAAYGPNVGKIASAIA